MVVEGDDSFGIVEAFDILPRLSVITRSIDMLEHMEILGDAREPLMTVHHVVQEVNIAEIVACSRVIFRLAGFLVNEDHELLPCSYLHGHYDLVNVKKGDVLVIVQVSV